VKSASRCAAPGAGRQCFAGGRCTRHFPFTINDRGREKKNFGDPGQNLNKHIAQFRMALPTVRGVMRSAGFESRIIASSRHANCVSADGNRTVRSPISPRITRIKRRTIAAN